MLNTNENVSARASTEVAGDESRAGAESEMSFDAFRDVSVSLSRTSTWDGIETQAAYGPQDVQTSDYDRDLGDPGQYPYTRGGYPEMYRSRMWTLRNVVGYGAPEDTREGIRMSIAAGAGGINVICDPQTAEGIDPDHPAFRAEVGLEGCSLPSVRAMESLLEGIDPTKIDVAFHWTIMCYPLFAAAMIKKNLPLSEMRGSYMPDHLQLRLCGFGEEVVPTELADRATTDSIEFCVAHSPHVALGIPQAYDLRERGLTAAGEIALGMAIVIRAIEELGKRGLGVDQVAPSLAWASAAGIDVFEEVAKFRALRRVWAKTMHERFGATRERSMRLRIACHTSGRSLVHQRPLNNIARAAIESMTALLGGVQSLETCAYDEPVCIPTHDARKVATDTQLILAHEAGVARTADPLGGSYYVEALTNRVESEARQILARIEERGLIQAISSGEIDAWMDEWGINLRREIRDGDRFIAGVSDSVGEDSGATVPLARFRFDRTRTEAHIQRVVEMKASRDNALLERRLRDLYQIYRSGSNPNQAMIDALVADGTIGEVWGTVRMAHGYPYDPFNAVENPFDVGSD